MSKIKYITKNISNKKRDLIDKVNVIIAEYNQKGYSLTLRQVYYQMVSRDYIPNNLNSYKVLGDAVSDGRLLGLIDWYAITDRGRSLRGFNYKESPADVIYEAIYNYKVDRWKNQPHHVEVWVEKEALVDVVGRAASRMYVDYYACKGYNSQSEMWAAAQRMNDSGKECHIIYLGDHDPSGLDMTRDIRERMAMFGADVSVERVALNIEQVEAYNPPPNPAKVTDKRFEGYANEFGLECWELDALQPEIIEQLIIDKIEEYCDFEAMDNAEFLEIKGRKELQTISNNYEKVVDYLKED